MKKLLSALLVVVLVQFCCSAPISTTEMLPENEAKQRQEVSVGRMDQLLRTFGMSPCVSSCMLELHSDFIDIEADENHPDHFNKICDQYTSASECFKSCPDVDERIFDVAASGVNYMCVEKRAAFEQAMPCIKQQKNALKKECNQKCKADLNSRTMIKNDNTTFNTEAIRHHFRNSSELFEQISELCVILRCSVDCGRELLNNRCDRDLHVGDLFTEVKLRPLVQNAQILQKSPPEVREFISRSLPESCAYIVDIDELEKLRHGVKEHSTLLSLPRPLKELETRERR